MRIAEFDLEKKWWSNRQESDQSWKVSVADIVESNYNLDIKNPNTPVEIHDDPDELLKRFHDVSGQVADLQSQLKKLLLESLK
jgi:type I restriction enzyme M protein